jgi:hypothetical protein
MWKKIERRWLATYELLHIAAYRLLGKSYRHTAGLIRVQPTATLSRGQHLFSLLFPLLVVLLATLGSGVLWLYTYQTFFLHIAPQAYYTTAPLWHIGLQLLLILLPLFAAPAYFDVREAIRLLTIQPTETVTGDR